MKRITLGYFILLLILFSCVSKSDFEIVSFDPFFNFDSESDTLLIPMDLSDAVTQGILIPSQRQSRESYFKFNFKIINNFKKPKVFCYKIFYQNESYKHYEFIDGKYNLRDH